MLFYFKSSTNGKKNTQYKHCVIHVASFFQHAQYLFMQKKKESGKTSMQLSFKKK